MFLLLALVGFRSDDEQVMRAVYIALEVIGWYVIVSVQRSVAVHRPHSVSRNEMGFVQHYWVLSKLVITVGASLLLLLHMQVMSTVAQAAATGVLTLDHLRDPEGSLSATRPPQPRCSVLRSCAIAKIVRHFAGGMQHH